MRKYGRIDNRMNEQKKIDSISQRICSNENMIENSYLSLIPDQMAQSLHNSTLYSEYVT